MVSVSALVSYSAVEAVADPIIGGRDVINAVAGVRVRM